MTKVILTAIFLNLFFISFSYPSTTCLVEIRQSVSASYVVTTCDGVDPVREVFSGPTTSMGEKLNIAFIETLSKLAKQKMKIVSCVTIAGGNLQCVLQKETPSE